MDGFSVRILTEQEAPLTLAEGYMNPDLNGRYIQHAAATHLFPASEGSIEGIFKGDVLIVDRALHPKPGSVIIADIEGEYQIRRVQRHGSATLLVVDDGSAAAYPANEEAGYCCGVVTHSIHCHS